MAKEKTIKLNFMQKLRAFSVLLLMYVCIAAMFLLNNLGIDYSLHIEKCVFMLLIILLLTLGLFFYCVRFAKKLVADIKYIFMIAVMFLVSLQINIFISGSILVYARPLLLLAMLVTILIGMQTGLFLNTYFMLVLYFYDVFSGGFTYGSSSAVYSMLNIFLCGTIAVMDTSLNKRRYDTILSAFKIGFLSLFIGVLVYMMFEGINDIVFFVALSSYLSVHMSILLYLFVLPVLERIFNIITSYRLNELTDHNRYLLKKLAELAPGTFSHSLAVSNLAEACAIAIGENAQLARAAAYYHDIGKIKNPLYFKENQSDFNPHDDLTPELSTNFIKRHTNDGYKLCKENRLPDDISDICRQHHGTTVIKYFYYQAKKYTDGNLSIEHFRYDGPKPISKIAAIIMIADASEAAIRALPDRKKANVEAQVKAIIDERMDLEQFSECDITMHELYTIIEVIVKISAGIYHERIDYPKIKFLNGIGGIDANEFKEQPVNNKEDN